MPQFPIGAGVAEPSALPRPFLTGLRSSLTSIFVYVLLGTFVGVGALARDLGFSATWAVTSTVLIWAAPAQVILISALAAGAAPFEAAVAVGLSGVRLLPMVVSVLPLFRTPRTPTWRLMLLAHLIAVSLWVEAQRLAPGLRREDRLPFFYGLGLGMVISSGGATLLGYVMAGRLPMLFTAALLFLTPMSFLVSTARNARQIGDRLALALGLVLCPALAAYKVELDLLWTGLVGGTLAYFGGRLWTAWR